MQNPNLNNAEKNLLAGLACTTMLCYRRESEKESDPREAQRLADKAEVWDTINQKLMASFTQES